MMVGEETEVAGSQHDGWYSTCYDRIKNRHGNDSKPERTRLTCVYKVLVCADNRLDGDCVRPG